MARPSGRAVSNGAPASPSSAADSVLRQFAQLLGLARRARKLVLGVTAVENELRRERVKLVLLALDASYGQKKGVVGLCRKTGTPIYERFRKEQIAAWLGCGKVTALGVQDAGFAKSLKRLLERVDGASSSSPSGVHPSRT